MLMSIDFVLIHNFTEISLFGLAHIWDTTKNSKVVG